MSLRPLRPGASWRPRSTLGILASRAGSACVCPNPPGYAPVVTQSARSGLTNREHALRRYRERGSLPAGRGPASLKAIGHIPDPALLMEPCEFWPSVVWETRAWGPGERWQRAPSLVPSGFQERTTHRSDLRLYRTGVQPLVVEEATTTRWKALPKSVTVRTPCWISTRLKSSVSSDSRSSVTRG
jgi:hypothetical protein